MRFEFATASRIVFGAGVAKEAPINVKQWGNRCALVSGGNASRSAWLEEALHQEEIDTQRISIHGEPTVDAIRDASRTARDFGAQRT
jgi:alcohol dehydrogenase class IV